MPVIMGRIEGDDLAVKTTTNAGVEINDICQHIGNPGLGSVEVAEVSRLVTRLAREYGVSVLLIEHNMDLIIEVCDRVVVLDFGKEIARGTPDEIRRDQRVLQAYMGESPASSEPDKLAAGLASSADGRSVAQ